MRTDQATDRQESAIPEAAQDDSAPGTVFTTHSVGGKATWIVLERSDNGMRYARVARWRIAGTISVTCTEAAEPGQTRVSVTYDVTSLGTEGVAFVEQLEANYDTGARRRRPSPPPSAGAEPGAFTAARTRALLVGSRRYIERHAAEPSSRA